MRGKHIRRENDACTGRITPAGAGKTLKSGNSVKQSSDHPRRCGENPSATASATSTPGSPPQVRGNRRNAARRSCPTGITPAGAGKTIFNCADINASKDHPRRCGENGADLSHSATALGSPPQVRGKPPYNPNPRGRSGITPAGAGKTRKRWMRHAGKKDHPRRCGENADDTGVTKEGAGSPPQVRGKLPAADGENSITGITPAGAGKTAISTPVLQPK